MVIQWGAQLMKTLRMLLPDGFITILADTSLQATFQSRTREMAIHVESWHGLPLQPFSFQKPIHSWMMVPSQMRD
jgi:hypothetical protein